MDWDTYKKCSRCEELFPVPIDYEIAAVLRYSTHDRKPGAFKKYYQYDWKHLCPKCMDEIKKFMNGFFNE